MNVSLNHILNNTFNFVKEKFAELTPIQKKIVLVTSVAFSCFSLVSIAGRCLRMTYISQEKEIPKKSIKKEEKIPADKIEQKPSYPPKKHVHNIPERLKKNLEAAENQHASEKEKGFTHTVKQNGDFPFVIQNDKVTVFDKEVGMACSKGRRPGMEDAHLAEEITFNVGTGKETEKNIKYRAGLFGVFDGHGGKVASTFVSTNLAKYLTRYLEANNKEKLTEAGIWNALRDCFYQLAVDYQGMDGTTATVALVLENRLYVANVGDSRTVLSNDGKAIQLSEDAKPGMERYQKTIEKLGGFVTVVRIKDLEISRMNGSLAVARAIGDKNQHFTGRDKDGILRYCVSPNPKITCYSLDDIKNGHLILACDGLYEVATTNEVVNAVSIMDKQEEPVSVSDMATQLVDAAIESGSKDNVSVLVIKL